MSDIIDLTLVELVDKIKKKEIFKIFVNIIKL